MDRHKLITSTKIMPTGNVGYCLCNKEQTLRYAYYTMFKEDLNACDLFDIGVSMESDTCILV